jgi:hypothetical protein
VATYGGHVIPLGRPDVECGAGFELDGPAPRDFSFRDGSLAGHLSAGSRICLVTVGSAASPVDLLEIGLETAHRALDLDGVKDGRFLALPDSYTDHILWWRDAGGQSRVVLSVSSYLGVHVSASVQVVHEDGGTEPIRDHLPAWHPAMRHFRFSQKTSDLFESYRYLFLAIESALSARWPRGSEGELAWFLRCNRSLERLGVDFSAFAGPGVDPVEAFSRSQYESFRCALFHAKVTASSFLPGGGEEDRRLVFAALGRLGQYVHEVFKHAIGAPTYSGGMTLQGIQSLIDTFKDELILVVTEDDSPAHESDTEVSPKGLPITELPTRYLGVADGLGYAHDFVGEAPVSAMRSTLVRRVVSKVPSALMTAGTVESLDVNGFHTFEHRHRWDQSRRWGGINARFKY